MDRTLVISGSCSPVTHRQIGWAFEHGFAEVAIDTVGALRSRTIEVEICELAKRIIVVARFGTFSDRPYQSRSRQFAHRRDERLAFRNLARRRLGRVLREALRARSVRRVAVVGGDTSGHVARSLEIEAVGNDRAAGTRRPSVRRSQPRRRGRRVSKSSFKGGQVGYDDFFGTLLRGRSSHSPIGATK